jgi:hypothetical protein
MQTVSLGGQNTDIHKEWLRCLCQHPPRSDGVGVEVWGVGGRATGVRLESPWLRHTRDVDPYSSLPTHEHV